MMGRGYGFANGCGYFGYGLMPTILILLFLGIILYLIFSNHRKGAAEIQTPTSQALSILNERLAKGEITQEEYEKIKKVIGK